MTTARLEWNRSIGTGDRVEEDEARSTLRATPEPTGARVGEVQGRKPPPNVRPPAQTATGARIEEVQGRRPPNVLPPVQTAAGARVGEGERQRPPPNVLPPAPTATGARVGESERRRPPPNVPPPVQTATEARVGEVEGRRPPNVLPPAQTATVARVEKVESRRPPPNVLPPAPTATGAGEGERVETAPQVQSQPMDTTPKPPVYPQSPQLRVPYKYNETLEEKTSPAVRSPPINLVSSTTVPESITPSLSIVSPLSKNAGYLLKSSIVAN